jgi:hypothetical protein
VLGKVENHIIAKTSPPTIITIPTEWSCFFGGKPIDDHYDRGILMRVISEHSVPEASKPGTIMHVDILGRNMHPNPVEPDSTSHLQYYFCGRQPTPSFWNKSGVTAPDDIFR